MAKTIRFSVTGHKYVFVSLLFEMLHSLCIQYYHWSEVCYLSFYWMVCSVLLLLELYLGNYCSTPVENNHQFHPLRHRGKQPGKDFPNSEVSSENFETLSIIFFVEILFCEHDILRNSMHAFLILLMVKNLVFHKINSFAVVFLVPSLVASRPG